VDFVADSIARLHQKDRPAHEIYHLSSGTDSETFVELTDALSKAQGKRGPVFAPSLEGPSSKMVNALAGRAGKIGGLATLMKVFLPYLVWDTVFDNSRVIEEMGRRPAPFSKYCFPLLRFSRENNFLYKYRDWPSEATAHNASQEPSGARDLRR
jgi:nucleoside-diphosphate-sugar epimerase